MDKNKALDTLSNLGTTSVFEHKCIVDILIEIVKEIPDEPTVMEQFCKWKEFDRRPRGFICNEGVKTFSNISFAQALEAAAKGKRVTHETWSKRTYITQVGDRFVRASIDSDNVDDRHVITTEMLTGWIVLDK